MTFLTWLFWAYAQLTRSAPHPNARPGRYVGRHAANRKRDNA